MLEKIIKKMHSKVAFSVYGILEILVLLLPLIVIAFGIYFRVTNTNNNGVVWIVIGIVCLAFSFRKFKDMFVNYKYILSPKKYPLYQHLVDEGIDVSKFDKELEDANIFEKLNKKNPVIITENFIFGFSQVSFFAVDKASVLWAYEYNGNGIVFYDKYKFYGFTYFPTVDGNDELMEILKVEMPYIYLGTDFDYKTIMHDSFDETVKKVNEDRLEFLADPEGFRIRKAEEERKKAEEEAKKMEEALKEKDESLKDIEENSEFFDKETDESNETNLEASEEKKENEENN